MYARFHASMIRPQSDGSTLRAHLEAAARRGSATAIQALREPPFPRAVTYLWAWLMEIRRGLGVGVNGSESLTWVSLDAWARRTERAPEPHEVDALFTLDAALREREPSSEPPSSDPDDRPVVRRAWPTKKPQPENADA